MASAGKPVTVVITIARGQMNIVQQHADLLHDVEGKQVALRRAYSADVDLQGCIQLLLLPQVLLAGRQGCCKMPLMAS